MAAVRRCRYQASAHTRTPCARTRPRCKGMAHGLCRLFHGRIGGRGVPRGRGLPRRSQQFVCTRVQRQQVPRRPSTCTHTHTPVRAHAHISTIALVHDTTHTHTHTHTRTLAHSHTLTLALSSDGRSAPMHVRRSPSGLRSRSTAYAVASTADHSQHPHTRKHSAINQHD
jgi:hypothetical protein